MTRAAATPPADPPWIRSYAIIPRRMSDGGWAWFRSYEWRWRRTEHQAPRAIAKTRLECRLA